jgi:hypothetical protein
VLPATHTLLNPLDNDLWSHMRTGQWILENGKFPWDDPFVFNAHGPYIAYSWTFEILLYKLHAWFGLSGTVWYALILGVVIMLLLFTILQRLSQNFTLAAALAMAFGVISWSVYRPRSWLVTVLLFIVFLDLLLHYRESGRALFMWLLVPVMVLWANVHVQFVLGLMLLGLFGLEALVFKFSNHENIHRPSFKLGISVLLACGVATLVNPYGWHVYSVLLEYRHETEFIKRIDEFLPPTFRYLNEWLALGLFVTGGVLCFMKRNASVVFPALLLLMGAAFGFTSARSLWLVGVCGAFAIAMLKPARNAIVFELKPVRMAAILPLWLVGCLVWGERSSFTNTKLAELEAAEFPKDACTFITKNKLNGPVYSVYGWGGYLIWRLDNKVAIDGRTYVHGQEKLLRALNVWDAKGDWRHDADFKAAGIIIAPLDEVLTQTLIKDPAYDVLYKDALSVVIVPVNKK